jgi:hypothetical protein
MVRRREAPSPDDALHRRANHESPDAAILRDAAKTPLLRMRTVIQSNKSIKCGISGISAAGIG